jgi:hypothetical protein
MPVLSRTSTAFFSQSLHHLLMLQLLSADPSAAITPFHACFSKAGVTNPSDFISIEANEYGSISFAITPNGDDNCLLNSVQLKKINSLFSWYWNLMSAFQAWCTLLSAPTLGARLFNPGGIPISLSAIYNFCKSVICSISDYKTFKNNCLLHSWHNHLSSCAWGHNFDKVPNFK